MKKSVKIKIDRKHNKSVILRIKLDLDILLRTIKLLGKDKLANLEFRLNNGEVFVVPASEVTGIFVKEVWWS